MSTREFQKWQKLRTDANIIKREQSSSNNIHELYYTGVDSTKTGNWVPPGPTASGAEGRHD